MNRRRNASAEGGGRQQLLGLQPSLSICNVSACISRRSSGIVAPQSLAGTGFPMIRPKLIPVVVVLLLATAFAQGTRDDYGRAERLLPWNVRRMVYDADV